MKNLYKAAIYKVFILTFLLTFSPSSFAQEKQAEKINTAPVLDYEAEMQKPFDKDNQKTNKLFNNSGVLGRKITELPIGVEPLPTINHWWHLMPALPTAQSNAVIFGEVINAKAHLSDDKTAIYSEFLVRVEKVFKDTSSSIILNDTLSTYRLGGNVRFASGRVNEYSIYRQGMPQKGEHYILFLKQTEDNFTILTGYKIAENRVAPLDGEDTKDPRSNLSFAIYRNAEVTRFLQDLQTALEDLKTNE